MQNHVVRGLLVLPILGAGACGVGGSVSGQLGADRFGDLSNPPAERGDGRLVLAQACGQPSSTAAPYAFARTPYLQRVGAGSAELAWVSSADPGLSVVVSATDGAVLTSPLAAKDPSAALETGAAQWLAPLAPLAPDTVYCYDVKTGSSVSERLGFRTAPAPGAGARVRFLAIGDSGGGGDDQTTLRDQMATVPFDFMIHTGDIPYGGGTRAAFEERFFKVYADFLKYFPVFPASGNHEYDSADAAAFREVFVLPENGGPDGIERWYSFDWGDVHFVALDSERTGPVQAAWLDADLTANQLPWTIAYWHKPPFSSGEHGSDGGSRTHFVPILEKHKVPLVLNGHDHDYERTTPQNGVTYVVTGGGGVGVRSVGTSSFTAFSDAVIHFVYVTVAGNELALHAIDGLGQEFDSLVIRH
jgi:calcineurin-like phosphoesterase family protein